MKSIVLIFTTLLLSMGYWWAGDLQTARPSVPSVAPAPAPAQPVVLELFTSQGCSSCPPADALLKKYAAQEGVIALSYHVDYWNYLGWEDPFSNPYFSARQREYTESLGARTYTPQLVINGSEEHVGSRTKEVAMAVAGAARRSNAGFEIAGLATPVSGKIRVSYELTGEAAGHRVSAVLVQPAATSKVKRGENGGRELSHANVVRDLQHAPAAATGTLELTPPEGMAIGEASVILLVQHIRTRAIVGAARVPGIRP